MKKIVTMLCFSLLVSTISFGNVSQYYVDEQGIENLFQESENNSFIELSHFENFQNSPFESNLSEKDPWLAVVFSAVFFTGLSIGISGLHRMYLGAGVGVFIGYLCTGGGFGIVQLVDTVVLLMGAIDGDISEYVDNTRFLMWL